MSDSAVSTTARPSSLTFSTTVDPSQLPQGVITFGSTVTVKDLKYGDLEKYQFVGPGEEDYSGTVMKILTSSPLASALVGKKVGDKVQVEVPKGTLNLEVIEIEDLA